MSKKLQVFLLSSSMLVIVFALVGGLGVHASSNGDSYKQMTVYSEVLNRIRTEYVEEPNINSVTSGALHGLLESLDADSSYLSPAEYKAFKANRADGKAGISAGDIIEFIDGQSTHEMSLASVKARLSGEPGSRLDCSIIRTRKIEPQKITIDRELVGVPAVQEQTMADGVGYVKAQVLNKG